MRPSAEVFRPRSTTFALSTVFRAGKRRVWKSAQDKGHGAEIKVFVAAAAGRAEPPPITTYLDSTRLTLSLVESLRSGLPAAMPGSFD